MVLSAAKSRARGGAASSRAARGGAAGARGGVRAAAGANPALAPRTSEMAGDPFGLLLSQRVVFLGGEVNDFSADAVISQLLLLDATDSSKDIRLFINSPGGFILGAGAPGKRLAMPNARVMIHQPLGGASGQAKDLEIQAKEIMYHKVNINRIMAGYTGKTEREIELDTDRDRYMSPLEAKKYGIIDDILGGEEATFDMAGQLDYFPKTKQDYLSWWKEAQEDMGARGSNFSGVPREPNL